MAICDGCDGCDGDNGDVGYVNEFERSSDRADVCLRLSFDGECSTSSYSASEGTSADVRRVYF